MNPGGLALLLSLLLLLLLLLLRFNGEEGGPSAFASSFVLSPPLDIAAAEALLSAW